MGKYKIYYSFSKTGLQSFEKVKIYHVLTFIIDRRREISNNQLNVLSAFSRNIFQTKLHDVHRPKFLLQGGQITICACYFQDAVLNSVCQLN